MPKTARHTASTLLAAALLALTGTATVTTAGAHGGVIRTVVLPVQDGNPCNSCGG